MTWQNRTTLHYVTRTSRCLKSTAWIFKCFFNNVCRPTSKKRSSSALLAICKGKTAGHSHFSQMPATQKKVLTPWSYYGYRKHTRWGNVVLVRVCMLLLIRAIYKVHVYPNVCTQPSFVLFVFRYQNFTHILQGYVTDIGTIIRLPNARKITPNYKSR